MSSINLARIDNDALVQITSPALHYDATGVNILSIDATSMNVSTDINLNQHKITGAISPSQPSDLVNKQYVDLIFQGLSLHAACRGASIYGISLNTKNGDNIGDITVATGDRILLKDQANAVENGIYVVNAVSPLSRADDLAIGSNASTVFVYITDGSINMDSQWACNNQRGHGTVGSDNLTFVLFASSTDLIAGNGLTKQGNAINVNPDNFSLECSNDALRIKSTAIGAGLSGASGYAITVDANLPMVVGLGEITSGSWAATTIDVPYGGTGQTSFNTNGIVVGNGSNALSASNLFTFDGANVTLTGPGDLIVGSVPITPNAGDIIKQQGFNWSTFYTNAIVTGLQFTTERCFIAYVSVSTNDLFELWTLRGILSSTGWTLVTESIGDTTGLDFDIDNTGQILFTASNPNGTMTFRANTLN